MKKQYKAVIAVTVVFIAAISIFGISRLDDLNSPDKVTMSATTASSSIPEAPTSSALFSSTATVSDEQDESESGQLGQNSSTASVSTTLSNETLTDSISEITIETTGGKIAPATDQTAASTESGAESSNSIGLTFGKRKNSENTGFSEVYYTRNISSAGLLKIYKALGKELSGKVACKLSTGESNQTNYLRPEFIKETVDYVNGTIVECNTAYGGVRSSTALHKQVAEDRGFTEIADFDLLDENGSMKLPIKNGKHLSYNLVGKNFDDYDSYLILSHFKGHSMAGFGGSIKNISIGLASRQGKCRIHTAGKSDVVMLGTDQDAFLECMADAAKSVFDSLDGNMAFINVMNNLSVDCDCIAIPAKPQMADVGILASLDPVALDQACVDIVYSQKEAGGAALVKRMESLNGLLTLERAEENGLGSRNYDLISIDG